MVGNKMRSLEAKHRQDARKVSSSKSQATQTGSSIDEEESLAYKSEWHLQDIFWQSVRGSNADQLEQEGMGIVTESATPGIQHAAPENSQSAATDENIQNPTSTWWCPQNLLGTHWL